MADKIIVRKGLKSQIPILEEAELGFCTDTKELYIGSNSGNILLNGSGSGGGGITLGNVTSLTVPSKTSISVALQWSPVAEATSYDIEVNGVLRGNVSTTSYNVTSLNPSTTYEFVVKARNATQVATGTSLTISTNSSETASIATTNLDYYYNARDGIKTGNVLKNIAPSGLVNDATVVGATVDTNNNYIPLTPAITDYIALPVIGTTMVTEGSFTFEYIFYISGQSNDGGYHELYASSAYLDIDYTVPGFYLELYPSGAATGTVDKTITYDLGTAPRLMHIVKRFNATTGAFDFFINGVKNETATTILSATFARTGWDTIRFNSSNAGVSFNVGFHAVRYYKRDLTDQEIATNVANGTEIGM